MDGNERKSFKVLSLLLILLVGLLVFWGSSNEKKINRNYKLSSSNEVVPQKKIEVSEEVYNLQDSFANVAEVAKLATVNISVVQLLTMNSPYYDFYYGDPFEEFFQEYFGAPNRKGQPKTYKKKSEGTGSGVIIDPKGYVLTNNHVVEGADEITVTLSDGKAYKGKVIGKDSRTDLAVVKLNPREDLPYVQLGDSDVIRIGDWAIAIGSPFGLEQTVTVGIISAKRQSLQLEGKVFREMIQTDAAINRGNSGGPLLNIRGEIIGINTAIYAPTGVFSGIGFAIPINKAKEILDDLIHKGKVVRGWLGIEIKPVDDIIAKHFNLPDNKGVLVNGVMEGSAGAKGGLVRGDVIMEFEGRVIKDAVDLQDNVSSTSPGKKVKLSIMRDGKRMTLDIELGEMPSEPGVVQEEEGAEEDETGTAQWLGMTVSPVTRYLRQQFDLEENQEGVVITNIDRSGKASEIGLMPGDLLKAINQYPVKGIDEFEKATGKVKLSEGVMFDIIRRGKPLYITYTE